MRVGDGGSSYPWPGGKPWPGTHDIKAEFAKNHPDRVKDGWYIKPDDVDHIKTRLQVRRDELAELRKHLVDAGKATVQNYGQFQATVSLHSSHINAQQMMVQGLEKLISGFEQVIERLNVTQTTARNAEIDNVDAVTYANDQYLSFDEKTGKLVDPSDTGTTSNRSGDDAPNGTNHGSPADIPAGSGTYAG